MKEKFKELSQWLTAAREMLRQLPKIFKKKTPVPEKQSKGTVAALIFAAVGILFSLVSVAALVFCKLRNWRNRCPEESLPGYETDPDADEYEDTEE